VTAEAEHGQGDDGFGGVEAERDADDESDLGVHGLDEGVGQPVFDRGDDGVAVTHDALGNLDEGGQSAAAGPADPTVEGLDRFGWTAPGDGEHGAQALLQRPGTVQGGVGLGDPGQLLTLPVGEVGRVLPQRPAGVLEPFDRPGWPVVAAAATGRAAGGVPRDAALHFQGLR
jgi:hypothetical protein